jgi:hypothetical protein
VAGVACGLVQGKLEQYSRVQRLATYGCGMQADEGRPVCHAVLCCVQDGAFGGGAVEAISMKSVADSVYDLPALSFSLKLARTHMPPRRWGGGE